MRVEALGLLTGWGEGVEALPAGARAAAGGRAVVALGRPAVAGDRFRRATRECLLGVAAVEAMLRDGGLARPALAGGGTGLLYVTAAAYGASNRAFVEGGAGAGTLHFPYTAPSAVPAEVAIEFQVTGSYAILIGAQAAARDALWQADVWLRRRACERVLVLAVETFAECADLYARGRWVTRAPLTEAAAAVLLGPGDGLPVSWEAGEGEAGERAGETLACAPLIALALARQRAGQPAAHGR